MAKSKVLVSPELLANAFCLPVGTKVIGAGVSNCLHFVQGATLYLEVEGSGVPATEYCTIQYKRSKRPRMDGIFLKFEGVA